MNKKITRNFDKEGNKLSETETINDVNEDIITKYHVTSLSEDSTNSMQNDALDNKDGINNAETMEIGEIKKK